MKKVLIPFILLFLQSYNLIPDSTVFNDEIQVVTSAFDVQQNSVSNVQFYSSNYGILGLNVTRQEGGVYWPRGTANQYIFSSGFWFGAQKKHPETGEFYKYVAVSYNPNSGYSWMVPGLVADGAEINFEMYKEYRVYYSTDMNNNTGKPRNTDDGSSWPLWIDAEKSLFGKYEPDISRRDRINYPLGPLFISNEDIVSVYKDTDLNYYEGGLSNRKGQGYPIGLQVLEKVYTWGIGDLRNVLVITYEVENISNDTLLNCWFGNLVDPDIARAPNLRNGAGNDRIDFFHSDESLKLPMSGQIPIVGKEDIALDI